jgi:5-methylcytosine-specific restriction protein A
MGARNPDWAREELILALDLYVTAGRRPLDDRDSRVRELSQVLRSLSIHPPDARTATFRSPNSVSLKLQNIAAADGGRGMSHGGQLERALLGEFAADASRLGGLAVVYRKSSENPPPPLDDSEQREYAEGGYSYRIHRNRERSVAIVQRKKQQAWRDGRLFCEVCGLRPMDLYAEHGDRALECHHIVPLYALGAATSTRLADLALVCASCHRVLHASNPPLVPVRLAESLSGVVAVNPRRA